MSHLINELNDLNNLNDTDLSKIIGLTVDIQLNNDSNILTGMIYSLLKDKKYLIRKNIKNKKSIEK